MVKSMKVRWLGNACLEVYAEKHILIDPNCTVEPEKDADIILLTHEHDDHFSRDDYEKHGSEAELYGPETALDEFDLDGYAVEPGDRIDDIEVLESDCYGSEESISYLYNGLLHVGDSAWYPETNDVDVIFTACFPDYYDDYIDAFKRLNPDIVLPFHYDPDGGLDDAQGLIERMDKEGIKNRLMEPGEVIEV